MPGMLGWANQGYLREGRVWWMLLEGQVKHAKGLYADGGDWRLYLFKSMDDGRSFRPASTASLESLRVGYGAFCSPRAFFKQGGEYHLIYHVSENSHLLPTVLWHARSKDLRHWVPDPFRCLGLDGSAMGLREADQVADPALLQQAGRVLLYYDATDNRYEAARIGLAVFPGTLSSLVAGFPDMTARSTFFPIRLPGQP
jgi:hypothetical protein